MFCYALISSCRRFTYIGKTNNLTRRLRQHNGEICGGAKYTRKGRPWEFYLYVSGFPTASNALCFEWAWKHKRARGLTGVIKGLARVCNKQKWTRKCPDACTIPLVIHTTDLTALEKIRLPDSVTKVLY
jgi:predicted GIY-YIG superfamily endonuclease